MKASSLIPILSIFLIFTSISEAWPWPPSIEGIEGLLIKRADASSATSEKPTKTTNNDSSSSVSETAKATASRSDSASASGTGSNSDSASASGTAKASASGTAKASASGSAASGSGSSTRKGKKGTKTTKKAAATSDIDPRDPAGGIQMVTPAPLAGAQYYKIGEYVTFAWNYTSLSVTPTAIDILASCSVASQTYTLAMNQTVDATGAVTWDTGKYQKTATAPLLMATYTLIVYDADDPAGITETPRPGYLGVYDQFTFGMYTPQPYTPLNEFKCATCSGALSDMERQALGFMFGMGAITILSFTWFAGGFGLF